MIWRPAVGRIDAIEGTVGLVVMPTMTPAVRIFAHGGPEVLRYGEYPLDPVGPHDVLVEVAAASVSGWDIKYRDGLPPGMRLPGRAPFGLPQQLGREAAGTVLEVGAAVRALAPGDLVVAVVHPSDPGSVEAARGRDNLSPGVAVPGHQALGGYAKYLVRHESLWFPLPQDTDLEQAAVTLWPFSTSHRVLRDRLRIEACEAILVLGASGGMGMATVQLAALMGARVFAVTRDPAKTATLLGLGAEAVVDTTDPAAAAARLGDLTDGHGVEHVVDYAGQEALLSFALQQLRLGGKVCVAAGDQSDTRLPLTAADLVRGELDVVGVRGARRRDALLALDLLRRGRLRTPILARFPLSLAKEAHELFTSPPAGRMGRIVLLPEYKATDKLI